MSTFIVPPPAPFVINDNKVEERFVDYKNKFLTFMKANGLDSKEEGQKIAIFKSFCGEDLCDQIEADESEEDSLNDVLQRLHDHYLPASNVLQERFNFFIRRQRPSENFDKYLIELKKIAKNCNFGELEENLLKVVLIMNMKDITEQQKILKDADTKKLDALVSDFRKFDAIKKSVPKKNANNKNQPEKQNQQPHTQKQNNPQPQKQTAPQPPKTNQPPKEKQNKPESQPQPPKQNQPKHKQPDSIKKESKKNGNHQGNAETKEKKGDKKKAKPQNGEPSISSDLDFVGDLAERVQKLST